MPSESPATVPAAKPAQLLLFEGIGVTELPQGFAEITGREQRFVLELLKHGQMARAARDAGYSEASAGSIASETLRKPKVFAFYQRCLAKVAANADALTARVCERSLLFHNKAIAAAQEMAELDELILVSESTKTGKKAATTTNYETRREQAAKAEKHYAALAAQADTLLASLIGKLTLKVDGAVTHSHFVLTPERREELVGARRRLQFRLIEGGKVA